jgi:hypothetical protein
MVEADLEALVVIIKHGISMALLSNRPGIVIARVSRAAARVGNVPLWAIDCVPTHSPVRARTRPPAAADLTSQAASAEALEVRLSLDARNRHVVGARHHVLP